MQGRMSRLRDRPALVCTLAFLSTAVLFTICEIFELPDALARTLNASGRWLDHAIYVALILIAGAICAHVISVLDKKRRQSEEKYETLVEQSDDGINIYQNGKLAYSSPRMTEILGYPIEEVMSGAVGRFVGPADAAFMAGFHASLKAKRPVPERFRIDLAASDGRLVPVEVRARQIDYRGMPGVMVVARDITETRTYEQAILAERENFRNSLEDSPLGIQVIEEDGTVAYANRALLDLWGYETLAELQAVPIQRRVTPETLARIDRIRERNSVDSSGDYQEDRTVIRKDGTLREVRALRKQVMWGGRKCAQLIYQDVTDMRQAERALVFKSALLEAQAETSVDGILVLDVANRVILTNQRFRTMWSLPDDLVQQQDGMAVLRYVESRSKGEDLVPTGTSDRSGLPGERNYSERELEDGRVFEVYSAPLKESDGTHGGRIWYFRDISERRQTEVLYRTLANNSPMGVFIVQDGRFIFVNPVFESLTGLATGAALGKLSLSLVHPDDKGITRLNAIRMLTEKSAEPFEFRYTTAQGETRWALERLSSIVYNGKRATLGNFLDATEVKRAEARLARAAEEWRSTFDSIADMISIKDRNNTLLRVNKAFADRFGVSPKELLGKPCQLMNHGTQMPPADCPCQSTIRTGKPRVMEVFQAANGTWLQESTSPIFGEHHEVVGAVSIIKDVSEFKLMQEQLMMTDRLASIGELVSGIAHELNNPLTGVIGFSQLVLEKDVPEDVREDLTIVSNEAQRASRIVSNLLTFARKHAPVKQSTQINSVIEDVLRLREYDERVNNIEVITRLDNELPEIMADYFQIQQVFLNIVVNAEFFMIEAHQRGRLTIVSEVAGSNIRVSFTDDGPGIPSKNLGRLFNPFFTTKDVGKGTGLGLSICHGIMAEHEGRIYATSESGKGATFIVELPIENRGELEPEGAEQNERAA
jgi:PAS domain S-box-containing protein